MRCPPGRFRRPVDCNWVRRWPSQWSRQSRNTVLRGERHRVPQVGRRLESIAAFPVFIQQIAVPQVGDAGAANSGEPEEGRRVWTELQNHVYPVASAFQRRPVVRRAEKDESGQTARPPVARRGAVVVGTPRYQAAKTVRDNRQLFQWHWPLTEKPLDQIWRMLVRSWKCEDRRCSADGPACSPGRGPAPSRGYAPSGSIAGRSCKGRGPARPVFRSRGDGAGKAGAST